MRYRALLLLASGAWLVSCVKDDSEDIPLAEIYQVVDHAFTERALVPLPAIAEAHGIGPGNWLAIGANTCALVDSITGDTAAFPLNGPVTIHLHYPDTGCTDLDGHRRAGLLRITYTDLPGVDGAIIALHSADLTDGPFRYRFWITDSVLGIDSTHVRIDSSYIFTAGDWGRRIRGTATFLRVEGQGDADPLNDVFTIAHGFTGSDRYGGAYSAQTGTPLRWERDCAWIGGGTATIDPAAFDPRDLDYGVNNCDDHLDFQAEGQSFGLTIP